MTIEEEVSESLLMYLFHFYLKCFLTKNPYHGSQPAFTCSTITVETLEQDVKYVQS